MDTPTPIPHRDFLNHGHKQEFDRAMQMSDEIMKLSHLVFTFQQQLVNDASVVATSMDLISMYKEKNHPGLGDKKLKTKPIVAEIKKKLNDVEKFYRYAEEKGVPSVSLLPLQMTIESLTSQILKAEAELE